jgi:hypothetical protein
MSTVLTPAKRLRRLQTLEGEIRRGFETFVKTGFALKEIHDDELFKEAGFGTWDEYLKKRVGEQFGIEDDQARRLIACAQIRDRLPETLPIAVGNGLSQNALYEFRRLAPQRPEKGQPYDVARINKGDAARVVQRVAEHCEQTGEPATAAAVRQAVDEELGVDRAAQAREAKARREEEAHIDLPEYLNRTWGTIEGVAGHLETIDADQWRQSIPRGSGTLDRMLAACEKVTALVKKAKDKSAAEKAPAPEPPVYGGPVLKATVHVTPPAEPVVQRVTVHMSSPPPPPTVLTAADVKAGREKNAAAAFRQVLNEHSETLDYSPEGRDAKKGVQLFLDAKEGKAK